MLANYPGLYVTNIVSQISMLTLDIIYSLFTFLSVIMIANSMSGSVIPVAFFIAYFQSFCPYHIFQALKSLRPSDTYMCHWSEWSLVHIMACCLFGTKPLTERLNQCWLVVNWILRNKLQWKRNQRLRIFIENYAFENFIYKMASAANAGTSSLVL